MLRSHNVNNLSEEKKQFRQFLITPTLKTLFGYYSILFHMDRLVFGLQSIKLRTKYRFIISQNLIIPDDFYYHNVEKSFYITILKIIGLEKVSKNNYFLGLKSIRETEVQKV